MVLVDELVDIEGQQRQVQQEWKPVAVNQEQDGNEPVQTGFWNKPWI